MATNFNVTPYYDDFDATKNFHRVLFHFDLCYSTKRVNTTSNYLTENQVTQFNNHVFKDGSQVIPMRSHIHLIMNT